MTKEMILPYTSKAKQKFIFCQCLISVYRVIESINSYILRQTPLTEKNSEQESAKVYYT